MPFTSHRLTARQLRLFLALLVAAFALGTVAHAGHVHAQKEQTAHHQICDYCVGFAHLGATPANSASLSVAAFVDEAPPTRVYLAPATATHTVAQPRAPPC